LGKGLGELCTELLKTQKETWPSLKAAYDSLRDVRVRDVACSGFSIRLQHNPKRMTSTMAGTDRKTIAERPCFLCPHNLPEPQRAILYREEFLILCNPMPVFPSHLTISHVDHSPQRISGHLGTFIDLISDLKGNWIVLYNGPQCGASAPDHLHFQAVPSGHTPVESEIRQEKRLCPLSFTQEVSLYRVAGLGRELIIIEGDNPAALGDALAEQFGLLRKALSLPADMEPMVNIVGLYAAGRVRLLLFPRHKHRPNSFFMEGAARVVVSPAVIEMAGVLVTPMEKDFEELGRSEVEAIYDEVTLYRDTNG
jgi:hypothetical protein